MQHFQLLTTHATIPENFQCTFSCEKDRKWHLIVEGTARTPCCLSPNRSSATYNSNKQHFPESVEEEKRCAAEEQEV